MNKQLPVIVGKPYKPARNIKPYQVEVTCAKGEACKETCWCTDSREFGKCKHTHGDHARLDGTIHTHKRTIIAPGNGSGWLERKASGEIIYHAPWLKSPTPFAQSIAAKQLNPKPRLETSAKALIRLRKDCLGHTDVRYTGRAASGGYKIAATNGHWALLEPGAGTEPATHYIGNLKGYHPVQLHDPELFNALERASLASPERSKSVTLMMLDADHVAVYAQDPDFGEFMETVGCKSEHAWAFNVDWTYLEMPLGCWPLTLWFKDHNSAVVFEPADQAWRFVLMPMRGGPELVKKRVREWLASDLEGVE